MTVGRNSCLNEPSAAGRRPRLQTTLAGAARRFLTANAAFGVVGSPQLTNVTHFQPSSGRRIALSCCSAIAHEYDSISAYVLCGRRGIQWPSDCAQLFSLLGAIDVDPQGSLSAWGDRRDGNGWTGERLFVDSLAADRVRHQGTYCETKRVQALYRLRSDASVRSARVLRSSVTWLTSTTKIPRPAPLTAGMRWGE